MEYEFDYNMYQRQPSGPSEDGIDVYKKSIYVQEKRGYLSSPELESALPTK